MRGAKLQPLEPESNLVVAGLNLKPKAVTVRLGTCTVCSGRRKRLELSEA